MKNNYTVLHLHTELSLLDSCTNHRLYTDKAAELGQKAIAFTEHGNLYRWIEKKMYANSKGLKYIHGVEMYLTKKLEPKVRDNYHTILLAKNYEGVKEINKLVDLSTQSDHMYYKPRITFDEFKNISNNVIKISACLASPLSKLRDESMIKYYDYLEIQPHINSEDQKEYNKWLYEMSLKHNKPLSVGTDTHNLDSYKGECRKILMLAKDKKYSNEDEFDLTYKSYDEVVDMFEKQGVLPKNVYLEALENTNRIAESVEDFELDTSFKYPVLYDNEEEVLKKRLNDMYRDKIKCGVIKNDKKYKTNVKEEMRVFKKIGMVGFMLFMSELISWCWENDIPVGPGRGSVCGSTIAYLSDITDVNPITWDTIFSRFANEDRKEIGDIDIDISPSQRHLVFEHIIEKFGIDYTGYVLSIGTVAEKGTIDEIGRALKIPLDEVKKIKDLYESNEKKAREEYKNVFYYFDGLKNTAISQSMHPAGIICSPITLPDNYGTFWNKDGQRILNIDMEEIHEVSLVKYDILGLKNVEIIKDCCQMANIDYPRSHMLDWDDKKVWEHITDSPVGIFQFESPYAFKLMKDYSPTEVNSLSLINASLRPSGETYRDRLIAGEVNKNPSELIDKLLEKNRGFLVFQEDTIKFLQQICGLSGSEADNIRRAIGRKQKDRLEAALPKILEGYCNMSDKPREVAEKEAQQFLDVIESSSSYQFGFNHSTGYSMIGYMCAYLRYYYPKEFIASYLNNANNDDDINMGTLLANDLGIKIYPPKFRHSGSVYTCGEDGIYKGCKSIKFISDKFANEINTLKNNKYDSFVDLLVDINELSIDSRELSIMTKLDFFSEFGNPNNLLKTTEIFSIIYGKKAAKKDDFNAIISGKNNNGDEQKYYVPLNIFNKFATEDYKETKKQIKGWDDISVIKYLSSIIDVKTTSKERIKYEYDCLGYCTLFDNTLPANLYIVTNVEKLKTITNIEVYECKTGKSYSCKMWTKSFEKKPFDKGDFIYIYNIRKEFPKIRTEKINPKTGKNIWIKDETKEKENWLEGYEVEE